MPHTHRLTLAFALLLTGCAVVPDQSMLHPAGPAAAKIAWLWWIMLGVSFHADITGRLAWQLVAPSSKPMPEVDR